jgi:hypothetical protein
MSWMANSPPTIFTLIQISLGWEYDLNSTKLAYDLLKELDLYHSVSLVLKCQNFYYEECSSGADIVFEDAYPVSFNATWSTWGIPCNLAYGDCGCDNCLGELTDVSDSSRRSTELPSQLGRRGK